MESHVLSDFSPDGKLFALVNDQGILRIWDTETNELKQEYTPNLHLSGPCTALIWVTVAETRTTKKKKSNKNLENKLYLALGNSKGGVSLYALAEGKILRNLKGEGHAGRVTAIVRGVDDEIYTTGEDCQIIKWSLATQERLTAWTVGPEKPQRLAYFEHSQKLAVGSRQIKIYAIESQELSKTLTGHSGEINLLKSCTISYGGKLREFLLSSSAMERIISVWSMTAKGAQSALCCTLLMEDIAHQISCQLIEETNMLQVAGVTRSGVIHIYMLDINKIRTTDQIIKPKVTIEFASDDTKMVEPIPAVAVSLQHGRAADHVLIAYGSKQFLKFEHACPIYTQKKQVLVRKHPKSLLTKSSKQTADNKTEGYVAALKTLEPIVNPNDVDYKSSLSTTKKKLKATEMPMESRLQNLNLGTPSTVGSQSKVQLLVQALHSKDATLLRSVLETSDLKTVELTVHKLPVQYIGPLVNELTQLMQLKRSNVEYSIKWLKVLVQTHASQLMALGKNDLLEKFGPCIGIIEYRSNCLSELSKLSGRLSLIVNQMKRNSEDALDTEDALIYEDKDENDLSDVGLNNDKPTSDGEWDEDDQDETDQDGEDGEEEDQMDISNDSQSENFESADEMET